MKLRNIFSRMICLMTVSPLFTYAQTTEHRKFADVINMIIGLISIIIPILASLALLAFLWGLVKFIFKAGDSKSHEEGKNLMIYGILALFVMVSFMAIINFFYGGLGFGGSFGLPLLPVGGN